MKTKLLPFLLAIAIAGQSFSQNSGLEVVFTAEDNMAYVRLDSIKIINLTQGGDTMLHWPDTVLSYTLTGIGEIAAISGGFDIIQNYPNPMENQTTISLLIPQKDVVDIIITDELGRIMIQSTQILDRGTHAFRYISGCGHFHFFTARWRGKTAGIKMLRMGSQNTFPASLDYIGRDISHFPLKDAEMTQNFIYTDGDSLLYVGHGNGEESGIVDIPEQSDTVTLQFATNIPCPGIPIVNYGGQTYKTIQVFGQCWLKENLNIGVMINGTMGQTNNNVIEKYCYDNEEDNCAIYGGLYQWPEMMEYTTLGGSRGICPEGWHIPDDEDWKVLEGAADSQYGIGDPAWNGTNNRGYDAGENLKSTSGWNYNGNGTDLFGFTLLPAGVNGNNFYNIGNHGFLWTSTRNNSTVFPYHRDVNFAHSSIVRARNYGDGNGFSVRCIKD